MGDIFDITNLFGGTKTKETPPRNLAGELDQILGRGPALLASQEQLSPAYTGLSLRNLNMALSGTPATAGEAGYWINSRTKERRATKPSSGFFGTDAEGWQYVQPTAGMAAQRGLLDIYGSDLVPAVNEANTARRTATYNDLRGLNPSEAGLYDELAAGALSDLRAGDRLTPDQIYRATQPVRADWASRGFGPGTMPEGLDESLQLFAGGQDLLERRRRNAAGTAALGSELYTMPALNFSPGDSAQSLLGLAGGTAAPYNVFGQLGGYGSNLFGQNYGGALQTNVERARNATQLWSGIMGMI